MLLLVKIPHIHAVYDPFFTYHQRRIGQNYKMVLMEASASASTSTTPVAAEGRRLTIIYMTQTGTSLDLAQRIARQARRKRFDVTLASVDTYDPTELVSEELVFFLVSTTGQGEFPTAARPFWNFLLRKGIPEDVLSDVSFAAFGLGDSTYPRFCWPVRLLSRRLKQLGAGEVIEHGEGDEQHYLGLEGGLGPWLENLWHRVEELLPMPNELKEIGRDEVLTPSTKVEVVSDGRAQSGEISNGRGSPFNSHLHQQGWTTSTLRTNERMTASDHFQDVRLLEFVHAPTMSIDVNGATRQNGNGERLHSSSITSATYRPGDVLCLHPVNDSTSVTEMLARLDFSPDTLISLSGPAVPSTVPVSPQPMTLRELFIYHLDFTSVPTRSFFDQIRLFSPAGSLEREKLDEYCGIYPDSEVAKPDFNPQDGIDEMFEYAQRPRRTIKEMLDEFKSVRIPLEHVADVFPWIKPREFSIASPPNADAIQLSVAIVKYKTRLRKPRTGLCTRWLAELKVGEKIPVLLKDGYLTLPPPETSLILVGPGTGCAPLRSLVMERLEVSAVPEIHLFLGFRNESKDYLFGQDWEALKTKHPHQLFLHKAFSRDREDKTYVQHLIEKPENGHLLWNAIVQRNAWIIVAGASGKMPEQVKGAFEKIAQQYGGMDEDQAKRFLDALERQKRWQEECWS